MPTLPRQNESALVNSCLAFLPVAGVMAWRNNTGARSETYKGKPRYIRHGLCLGSSDIIGIMPDGRFLAVECKVGKAQPTALQQAFIESVKQQGGLALCVWTLPELVRAIRDATKG